jgi:hypothetical protein
MKCARCHGLMVAVKMTEVPTCQSVAGWRCLLCGEMTDAGIEANRKGHHEPATSRARLPIVSPL